MAEGQMEVFVLRSAKKKAGNDRLPEGVELHCCDLLELTVEPASASVCLVDPPYDRKSVRLYGSIAERAAEWLQPGGVCGVYCGQLYIPRIIELMKPHLDWVWMLGMAHSGRTLVMRVNRMRQLWKPILLFVKPPLSGWWQPVDDLFTGGQREKDAHKWQQAVAESEYVIRNFCPPGGLVVDCCVGSGTTGVAAVRLGRRFVGCDVDAAAIEIARQRIAEAANERG